jgi:hypothetical protein
LRVLLIAELVSIWRERRRVTKFDEGEFWICFLKVSDDDTLVQTSYISKNHE